MTTMERAASISEVRALYSPQERLRRDQTVWTLVQGILAPLQFVVFLISLALVVSMLVIALHSLYLWVWWQGQWPERLQLGLALAAYASYVVNAGQFLLKLRQARLQGANT
mgnify:CR=1 FL=1